MIINKIRKIVSFIASKTVIAMISGLTILSWHYSGNYSVVPWTLNDKYVPNKITFKIIPIDSKILIRLRVDFRLSVIFILYVFRIFIMNANKKATQVKALAN